MNDLEGYEFCRNYMTDGEYILWKGRPEKGNLFTGQEVVMLPFSLLWLAFSVYWENSECRFLVYGSVGDSFCGNRNLPFCGKVFYDRLSAEQDVLCDHQ